jgi:hypothetical protein
MNTERCIEVCNRLLRGEQSAVAAYSKAIVAFEENGMPAGLLDILNDHRDAVLTLNENVRSMGGGPSPDSGAWGAFASTVQGAADFLGDESAVASLRAGEEAGKRDYESALEDEDVMPECKDLIRSKLLPATERHLELLEQVTT